MSLSTKSFVELCSVNLVLGIGMAAGILATLMGSDLITKAFGVTLAATGTAMSIGITRYWPFPLKEVVP